MSTHPAHVAARPPAHPAGAWARIVVATLARSLLTALLGMGFWAAAPSIAGWAPTTVMSGSMEPTVQVGDVVVARPVAPAELAPGQVLLFADPDQPGRMRLHRFHDLGPHGTIITKGDANPQADSSPIRRSAVRGVALTRVPFVGLPIVWLRERDWTPLAVTATALLGVLALTALDGPLRRRPAGEDAALAAAPTPETRRELLRHRRVRRRRHLASVLVTAVGLTGAGCLLPAQALAAPFSRTTANPTSSFAATTTQAPSTPTCVNTSNSVTISWTYSSSTIPTPDSFDVLVNGASYVNVSGSTRSATYSPSGFLVLGTTYAITVRTNVGSAWTATSASVPVKAVSLVGVGVVAQCA